MPPTTGRSKHIQDLLPYAPVGTVDRFQGQEAAVVTYSLTTSSPEDAPRGMEFLYSLNRLNVATSRARCAVFLVCSPRLLGPARQTPRQMQPANALCRYVEVAIATVLLADRPADGYRRDDVYFEEVTALLSSL